MDFDTNDSLNPETDELLQQDHGGPLLPVMVQVDGSVRVHQLPPRVAHSRNVPVALSSDPALVEIVAAEDPRRQYCKIICTGNPVFIGHDKQAVAQGTAGILPVGVPLELPTSAPIYAASASGGAAVVSYWTGEWAD